MKRLAPVVLLGVVFLAGCDYEVGDAGDIGNVGGQQANAGIDPVEITDANFKQLVLGSSQPVMVDCWAEWCGPCRALSPTVHELAADYKGRVLVGQLNVDDNTETPRQYEIEAIPTLLFFKDGKLVDTLVGTQSKQELAAKLDSLLGT